MDTSVNRKKLVPWVNYLIFFCVVNETVFNVSTPKISEQFGLSSSGVSWMMTIFLVFFGIGSLIYGKLSDIYSPKHLLFIGIALYNLGSVMGFTLRFSYPLVILSRAIQGIGASALPALVFVIIARYFEMHERGKVFGTITSTVSFGIGVGPVVGGFVAGNLHWSYLFLIPLFTLGSIPFLNRELPSEPRREGTVDILGAVLVAFTVGALVLYLNYSRWDYLAVFLVLLVLFLRRIHTAVNPFIPPDLFKNIRFRDGVLVGFSLFSIVMGIMFLIPLMLHEVHGLDSGKIGMILFPGAVSSVFFGTYAGSLADRKGNSFVVALGLSLLVSAMVLMAFFLSWSPYLIGAAMLLTYVGFSLFQTAMINSVSQTLPENETGIGMGVFNLVAIISGAVGTAMVGKILDGKWLDFSVLSTISRGFAYSNLLLAFSLVAVGGGALYLWAFRKEVETNKVFVTEPAE